MLPVRESENGHLTELAGLCREPFTAFASLFGVAVTLSPPGGDPILRAGGQNLCTKYHRQHAATAPKCKQTRALLVEAVAAGNKEVVVCPCGNGLAEAAIPLEVDGRVVAVVGVGQVFLNEPDEDQLRARAMECGWDPEEYLRCAEEISIFSREQLADIVSLIEHIARAILRQYLAAQEAGETRRQLAAIVSNISGMAYQCEITPPWKASFVSDGCLELLGYSADELSGASGIPLAALIEPADLPVVEKEVAAAVEKDIPYDLEYRMRRKDGLQIWVHERGRKVAAGESGRPCLSGVYVDVSQRKMLEARLLQSQSALLSLFENSPDVIARFDRQERHIMLSPSAELATGLKPEDFLGKTNLEAGMSAGHAKIWSDFIQGTFQAGCGIDLEFEFLAPDGPRYFHARSAPERGADGSIETVLTFARDITQRRKAELAMREAHDRLARESELRRALMAAIPLPIYHKDTGGRYLGCNAAFSAFTGVTENDLLGKTVEEIWPETLASKYRSSDEDLFSAGGTQVYEGQVRAGDGSMRSVIFSKSVFHDEAGKLVGLVGCFTDITDLQAREAALAAARNEAETAARSKAAFLATMSHELRTPLNGIVGFTNLLLATPLENQQREFCIAVRESSEALLQLINDILDFSKLEAGKLEIVSAEFDLNALCHPAAALLAPLAEKKGVELCYAFVPGTPRRFTGDAARLRQIILNLLGNAVKFTEKGSVELTVQKGYAPDGSPAIEIVVRDSGIGISPEQQLRLFSPYQQAHEGIAKKFGGTGLGLAISRNLANRMGGSISLASQPGVGSTFKLTLPLHDPPPPAAPATPGPLEGLLIDVVESGPRCAKILSDILHAAGADVRVFHSAEAQLEASPSGITPRAIILDGRIGVAGLSELVTFWQAHEDPDLRLILLVPPSVDASSLATLECPRVLCKPIDPDLLLRELTDSDTSPEVQFEHSHMGFAQKHPLRILVADDNPSNQIVALAQLRMLGYHPDLANNGEEVYHAVQSRDYDLIFLDLRMPVMDGFEAAHAIRALPGKSRRPAIVALSAWVVPGIEDQCAASGMDGFLAKPFKNADLAEAILKIPPHTPPNPTDSPKPA